MDLPCCFQILSLASNHTEICRFLLTEWEGRTLSCNIYFYYADYQVNFNFDNISAKRLFKELYLSFLLHVWGFPFSHCIREDDNLKLNEQEHLLLVWRNINRNKVLNFKYCRMHIMNVFMFTGTCFIRFTFFNSLYSQVLDYVASMLEITKEELAELSYQNAVRLLSYEGSKVLLK